MSEYLKNVESVVKRLKKTCPTIFKSDAPYNKLFLFFIGRLAIGLFELCRETEF